MNDQTRIAADAPFVMPFTAIDFAAMLDMGAFDDMRVELIEGTLQKMMPSGLAHGEINARLIIAFAQAIEGTGLRIAADLAIRIDETTVLAPDIAIFAPIDNGDAIPDARDMQMVIEIAGSTLRRDMEVKPSLYAISSIGDYWVVDLDRRQVHVFSQPQDGAYRTPMTHAFGTPIAVPGTARSIVVE